MMKSGTQAALSDAADSHSSKLNLMSAEAIQGLVSHAAHYLPAQGPITAFVHHNTLHAFEHLPFEQAVEQASAIYHCEPYLSKERYRAEIERGRIRLADLTEVLAQELGEQAQELVGSLVSRSELYMSMLMDSLPVASEAEIQWVIAAGDGVRSFYHRCTPWMRRQMVSETRQWVMRELRTGRQSDPHLHGLSADLLERWDETRIESWSPATWEEVTLTLLWRICRSGGRHLPLTQAEAPLPVRLRDLLLASYQQDTDVLVHEALIPFCATFSDQGLAAWSTPERGQGFYRAFLNLYGQGYPVREAWMRQLPAEIARLEREQISPETLIAECLQAFGVKPEQQQNFVTQSLLALRGWSGMLWQLESRPDRVRHAAPAGTLLEFLAVRLLLDRLASEYICRELLGLKDTLAGLQHNLQAQRAGHESSSPVSSTQWAYIIFLLAQSLGWHPQRLAGLSKAQWQELLSEIQAFSAIRRRRLFQQAYERRYQHQLFDALLAHQAPAESPKRPSFQLLCCLDEREESLRRQLEELEPAVETFGVAGFFGVAMYYRGAQDAHEMPLCPVVIRPQHRVLERVVSDDQARNQRAVIWTRRLGRAAYGIQSGSHGFFRGLAITLVGSIAAVPLVARVLFPRLTARLTRQAGQLGLASMRTELALERQPEAQPDAQGIYNGFLPHEMAASVESILRNIGLTQNFARLVLVMGHGSSSLNNPHEAAHDCGACGGGRGGPNARAFAEMANHPGVRQLLQEAGLEIPADTFFVGAYHNTCDDSITYYDSERIPASHRSELERVLKIMDQTCDRDAQERARRFHSASLLISPEEARRHVEARSEDLAQPRPEYGHATNANCFVGRRRRTRSLFMDRRCFLVSYDPESEAQDPASPILTRTLQAVVPVCAGINLEYYFSNVDPTGWGCGTKLPHNITSLLGVMDGAASDLRPGLPWQMVEIHEPVRLTMVVETTPARLLEILDRNPAIKQLCSNRWIWLATLDPDSARLQVFDQGRFVPYQPESAQLPQAENSVEWYGGLREHLDYALIGTPPEHKENTLS